MNARWLASLGVALMLAVAAARAQGIAAPAAQVGFDQHLGLRLPLQARFSDESGQVHALGAYLGRRPALLVMAYYSCSDLCDLVINGAAQGLRNAGLKPGRDLDVVVVSINPAETPAMALAKKREFIDAGNPANAGWHFLTGTDAAIASVTQAVGFRFRYDPRTRQYAHPAGVAMATTDGRISRYLLGVQYAPDQLRTGVTGAAKDEIGGLAHQLLLLCFHYDPVTGRYTLLIMRWVRVIACGIAALLAYYAWRQLRRDRGLRSEAAR